MTPIPEQVKNIPVLEKFSDDDKQLIWDIANDIYANYLLSGHVDPVVSALSRIQIDSTLYKELVRAETDQSVYDHYFKIPDLFVLKNLMVILDSYDKTKDSDEWRAYKNLIYYMMNKMMSDPWWYSRLGHFNRFMGSHMRDESYWPISFNMRFTPNEWYNTHDIKEINVKQINEETKSIKDVYKWD